MNDVIDSPKKPFRTFKRGILDKSSDVWMVRFDVPSYQKNIVFDVPTELPYCQYILQCLIASYSSYVLKEGDYILARNGNYNDVSEENLLLFRNANDMTPPYDDTLWKIEAHPEMRDLPQICHYTGAAPNSGGGMTVFPNRNDLGTEVFGYEDDRGCWVPNNPLPVTLPAHIL